MPAYAAAPSAAVMPGNNFEPDAVGREGIDFLAAAAEHERVAAFEAQHALSRERPLDQQRVDRLLAHRVVCPPLADIDALGALRQQGENSGRNQVVVQRDIRASHQLERADREQVGVPWPRADQVDLASRRATLGGNGSRPRWPGAGHRHTRRPP